MLLFVHVGMFAAVMLLCVDADVATNTQQKQGNALMCMRRVRANLYYG